MTQQQTQGGEINPERERRRKIERERNQAETALANILNARTLSRAHEIAERAVGWVKPDA